MLWCAPMNAPLKLYWHPMSPSARRAELGLAELKVPYERVFVDLLKGDQRQRDFLALNGNGKVPVLVDGDFVLSESNAILLYLSALYPERGLDGRTPRERGEVARWMFFNVAHLQLAGSQIFQHTTLLPPERRVPQVAELGRAEMARCLALVNEHLSSRPYLAGAELSLADLSMAPNLHFARGVVQFDLSPYPHVVAWLGRMEARPSWRIYNA